MKEIDYYKLPVNIYARSPNGQLVLIEDLATKKAALKTLKPSFNARSKSQCVINDNGFIEIHFAKEDLYTWDEITNNKFDSKTNKNVTFTLASRSNEAKASYSFVATEGINQYCQEGLRLVHEFDKSSMKKSILQKNFGLGVESKDNAVLDDTEISKLHDVMGNGYTVSFNSRYLAETDGNIHASWMLNTTVQCCEESSKTAKYLARSLTDSGDDYPNHMWLWKYSTIKNFPNGIYLGSPTKEQHIEKCLITGSIQQGILANHERDNLFVEDTIFFDCGNFGMQATMGAKTHFKGFVDIYNFHGKDMLKDVAGADIRFLWGTLVAAAKLQDGVHTDAAGQDCINSFMINFNDTGILFWNSETQQYETSKKGLPGNAEHVSELVQLEIKLLGLKAGFWGTRIRSADPTGPQYSQEFNPDGSISIYFLNNQIDKIKRIPEYF